MQPAAYTVDNVPQHIYNFVVKTFRIVAHTMGPVAKGAAFSQNHWSLYLIHDKGSVRLNMDLADRASTAHKGQCTVTSYDWTSVSNSAVKYWDFPARRSNLAIYWILKIIKDHGRDEYDMAEGGVGCRYTIMHDLAADGSEYVMTTSTDGATMDSIIGYNYSVGLYPQPLAIKAGKFLQR